MSFRTPADSIFADWNGQVGEYDIFISTSRWQKGEKIPLNGRSFHSG